jgi:MFS family permease
VFIIGLVLASAFPAILVYARERLPGKVGMTSGLFFGFAFSVGAAALGRYDQHELRLSGLRLLASAGAVRGIAAGYTVVNENEGEVSLPRVLNRIRWAFLIEPERGLTWKRYRSTRLLR